MEQIKKFFIFALLAIAAVTPVQAHVTDGKFRLDQVFSTPNFDYWRNDGGFLGVNHAACALNNNDCDRFTTGTLENPRDASNVNLGAAPYITGLASGEYIKFFNNGGGYSYGVFNSSNQLVNDLGAVSFEKVTNDYIIFKVDNWYTQIVYVNELKTMGTNGGIINVPLGTGTGISSWNPPSVPAAANLGFETGNATNWSVSNNSGPADWNSGSGAAVVTGLQHTPGGGKSWTVTPYGTYMMSVQPGGSSPSFDQATANLGLTAAQNTAIKTMLTQQSQTGGGDPTPTNAAWIKRDITLQAGVTYTIAWQYLSTDYTPFNDGSIMTLVHKTDGSRVPILNNVASNYSLLGFTNPGTGNYSTNSYGATGWQVATFVVPLTGDWVLGFAAFNLGDSILSPILLIDEVQGSTMLNGQVFTAVDPNAGSSAPPPPPPTNTLCCGGSAAPFNANTTFNTRVTNFSNRQSSDTRVIVEQIGNSSTINITQIGTKNNYAEVRSNGSNNNITVNQSGTSNSSTNFTELFLTGSNNTLSLTQQSTGGAKGITATVANNNNNVTVQQKDGGNHYLELNLAGGNKTVDVTQSGSAGHMSNITLSGGATGITVTQSGPTQQFYSITHSCANISCGPITVTQGN